MNNLTIIGLVLLGWTAILAWWVSTQYGYDYHVIHRPLVVLFAIATSVFLIMGWWQ